MIDFGYINIAGCCRMAGNGQQIENLTRKGKGRVKGVPNKITRELKALILGALDDAGGQAYLAEQAVKNPQAFLTLIGKVLPMTIKGTGADGEIVIQAIERRVIEPEIKLVRDA